MGQIGSETTTLIKDKTVSSVPLAITEIAHKFVNGDRNSDYGHPLDNFCRIAVMWGAIIRTRVTFKEVALMLMAMKESREVNKTKQDNLIDNCGFAECLDMCYAERDRRLAEGWSFDEVTGVWTKPAFDLAKALNEIKTVPCPIDLTKPWVPEKFDDFRRDIMPPPYYGDPPPDLSPTIICQAGEVKNG